MGKIPPAAASKPHGFSTNGHRDDALFPVSATPLGEATSAQLMQAASWYQSRAATLAERAKELRQMARARAKSADQQRQQREIASQRNAGH